MKPITKDTVVTAKKSEAEQTTDIQHKKVTTGRKKTEKTLNDLFAKELKEIYNAELRLLDALPEMVKAAYSENLQDAFEAHFQQTKRHVERLEKVVDRLWTDKNKEETCEAMEGLIKKCRQVIDEFEGSPVRDSALIIAAQKIEHYEIASYGSLCELADVLGYVKIAELLNRTLEEEETTDKNLSLIAQDVNDDAYDLEHEKVY